MMEKYIISNFKKIHSWKKNKIHFVNLETDPRLWYMLLKFDASYSSTSTFNVLKS
jgi:hypothetical protein